MLTTIRTTKFKPEFQKYKAQKGCYTRKRMDSQFFWETSFWLHKLIIRAYFKHQIQNATFVSSKMHFSLTKHCFIQRY